MFYPSCTTTANLNQRRELSLENAQASRMIGSIERHEAVGTQNYHALRLSTQRRAASGVSLSANYTRSYCVGNVRRRRSSRAGRVCRIPTIPTGIAATAPIRGGTSPTLSAVFETPQFANRALKVVASGWNVAGIVSARSGAWLTVTTLAM